MGQFIPKTYDDILERAINRVVARTDLTDITDGSSLKQVLAAMAREVDEIYFQMANLLNLFDIDTAIGNDLDERAQQFNPAAISRRAAQKATGSVVFGRAGTTGTVTISTGTIVKVPATGQQDEILFATTEEATIAGGSSVSGSTSIQAQVAGVSGNAAAGTITGWSTKPVGVDTVTNPSSLTNGVDLESDDSFRDRIKTMIKGLARCHVDGLEAAVQDAYDAVTGKRVVFSHVYEDPENRGNVILYIDDGGGTAGADYTAVSGGTILASAVGGETVLQIPNRPIRLLSPFAIYVNAVTQVEGVDYTFNPATGQLNLLSGSYPEGLTATMSVTGDWAYYEGLIAECQKIVDGDPADRSTYPGYRAAGVLVRVISPQVSQLVVSVGITVRNGFAHGDVSELVAGEISAYINGLGISEDVILTELIERTMAVPGVQDCAFTSPVENIVILDDEIARIQDANLTVS